MAYGRNRPLTHLLIHADTPVFMSRALREAVADREGSVPSPLSPDALSVLVRAEKAPVICRTVSDDIKRKLVAEGWAQLVRVNNHSALRITEKGKARIAFDEQ